jgi:hypothetical protein
LPLDLRLALSPRDTYHQLVNDDAVGTWRAALERVAFIAVFTGTLVTMSSSNRVPLGLVALGILCWSFVPIVQLTIGAIVIGGASRRRVSVPRAIELLFLGHLPWSLWLLTMVGLFTFTYVPIGLPFEVVSLLVPAVWTSVIVTAFGQAVLGYSPRRVRWLTAAHQTMTWAAFFAYVILASGFWARVLALLDRWR